MKNKIVGLVLILFLMLLSISKLGLFPKFDISGSKKILLPNEVTFLDKNSPVKMLSAQIYEVNNALYLEGEIQNNSDFPVTLLEMSISCGSSKDNFIIAQEKDDAKNMYVPIEVKIGDKYYFEKSIGGSAGMIESCKIGVKSWGKYGVKE